MVGLHIHSTLEDLHLHHFVVRPATIGNEIYQALENDPVLPGVVLLSHNGEFRGIVSRRRFLEAISRPYGRELFLRRPIAILHQFTTDHVLKLPGQTPITEAAQRAIARPSEFLYEPLVVECATLREQPFFLVNMHDVLQAQSIVHQLTAQLLQEKTRAERMQTEKMASLGKMMAGVAHEIRNPVNFIWGNLSYLGDYTEDLALLVRAFEQEVAEPSESLVELQQQIDLEFVLDDLPKVIQSMKTGTERLRNLVNSLRTFSRMDEARRDFIDIHKSLDSTLQILNNRLKEGVVIDKQYANNLPDIPCFSGQIGQVFMNLISNAIDALLDYATHQIPSSASIGRSPTELAKTAASAWEPRITLMTRRCDRLPTDLPQSLSPPPDKSPAWISICIRDNGPGIPPEFQEKVFEDFFTTKPVEEGTGLGLPITLQIVQEKHGGYLLLRSPVPAADPDAPTPGTEFEILLPTQVPPPEGDPQDLPPATPAIAQPGRELTAS